MLPNLTRAAAAKKADGLRRLEGREIGCLARAGSGSPREPAARIDAYPGRIHTSWVNQPSAAARRRETCGLRAGTSC
jgi:hypothetical protein